MIALDEARYFKFGMQIDRVSSVRMIDYFAVEYEFIIITSHQANGCRPIGLCIR